MTPPNNGPFSRLLRLSRKLEGALLATVLGGMMLLATSQILLRNLWGTGISWADPSLRLAVLWIALLGAMAATRDDNHIRIDLLTRFLAPSAIRYMRALTDLFSAFICGLLSWHGARFVYMEWQDGNLLFAGIPAWVAELILPVGFAVITLRFLLNGWGRLRAEEPR